MNLFELKFCTTSKVTKGEINQKQWIRNSGCKLCKEIKLLFSGIEKIDTYPNLYMFLLFIIYICMIHLSHGIIGFSLLILFVTFLYKNVLIIKTKLRVSESFIETCQHDCYTQTVNKLLI